MEFFNREKEIKDLINILSFEPNLVYFIYGPINSGKTALINEVIKKLPNDYIVFYIDLRAHFISRYDDFVRVLFKAHKTDIDDAKEFLRTIVPKLPNEIFGIPIPKDLLNELFKDKKSDDVFEYIIDVFGELRLMGKKPVLIIDELQVIRDLKINGYLIYELFNFFISLTKHRHLAHILCLSSDSLFIDKVYNEAMLQDRCKYYLVDDFDYETTKEFLKKYGFNDEEIEAVWEYFGGKPIKLIDIIQEKALGRDVKEYCKKSLIFKVRQLKDLVYTLEDENNDLFKNVLKLFENFKDKDEITYRKITEEIVWVVKKNILFVNVEEGILKPQSKLDLLAIREILKETF